MITNSSDSGDSFDSTNSDAVGTGTVAVIPQDLVNLVNISKPDDVPFEDHLLECTRFGAEAFVKAREITNNQSYLRELTESAKGKLYDTIADIGSKIGNKFTDEEGPVLAPFITTLEKSGSTLEGILKRVADLETITDLGKTDTGFGQVVNELNQALDPNRVDSVPGLVSAEISNLFGDGSPQRAFLESLISPVLTELANMKLQLETIRSTKEVSKKTPLSGTDFEDKVGQGLRHYFLNRDEIDVIHTGDSASGTVRHSRKGDYVIEALSKHRSNGRKIVVEAKRDKEFNSINKCMDYLKSAIDNRGADAGIFIHSSEVAPAEMPSFWSDGNLILVVWDETLESPELRAALLLAEAILPSDDDVDEGVLDKVRAHIGMLEKELSRNDASKKTLTTMEKGVSKLQNNNRIQTKNVNVMIDEIRSLLEYLSKGGGENGR